MPVGWRRAAWSSNIGVLRAYFPFAQSIAVEIAVLGKPSKAGRVQEMQGRGWLCTCTVNPELRRRAPFHPRTWGFTYEEPSPVQHPSASAALPKGRWLHPVVGHRSQRIPPGKGTFVPLPQGYILAMSVLESWTGLGSLFSFSFWELSMEMEVDNSVVSHHLTS